MDPNRFKGKVCLVTGGGSGIGKAACIRFAAEGGNVVVIDLNEPHRQETVAEITKAGGQAIFAKCNVGDSAEIHLLSRPQLTEWRKVDVVVNDAAMMTFKPIVDSPTRIGITFERQPAFSVFLFCKYSLPHMPPGGAFVNISSVHAHETTKNVVPYASRKAAWRRSPAGSARKLRRTKIRINCVAPGAVNTPMLWNNPNVKSGVEKWRAPSVKPEDIAAAICFLAAPEARFITGTTLVVDGGRLDIL